MQCSRFVCRFLLIVISLATADCSGMPSSYTSADMRTFPRMGLVKSRIVTAEESSLLPKIFVEALQHVENDYIDEVSPKTLMYGAVQGMLDVVVAEDAVVSPQIREAMQAVTTEDPIQLRKTFLEALTHAQELNSQPLTYGAVHGLMGAIDPEGYFMPPDTYKETYGGVPAGQGAAGLQVSLHDGKFTIIAPIEGGPAFHAGVQPGDQLVKVDGKGTKGMSLGKVISKLRGPEGSSVIISILRQGFTEPIEFTLRRQIVRLQNVRWVKLQENIGYIRLSRFHDTAAKELEESLHKLEEQSIKALIIDLRNNPGGRFEQAIAVANVFLAGRELITYTEARIPNQNMKYFSKRGGFHVGYPIAVIINANSASGSEIVASALQDLQRARIIGAPSFGRSTIQTIFPLSDGSALLLTTAGFFTPKGHSIRGVGVTPDEVVLSSIPERSFGDLRVDIQLQRAMEILTGHTWDNGDKPLTCDQNETTCMQSPTIP